MIFSYNSPAFSDVEVNSENFPDDVLRAYLLALCSDNSTLSDSEIAEITSLPTDLTYTVDPDGFMIPSGNGLNIGNLTGIEYFDSLTQLYINNSGSTSLRTADLSNNYALINLFIDNTGLRTLDLTSNTSLVYLECKGNKSLADIDLTGNSNLISLDLSSNRLTNLDITSNTALTGLKIDSNKIVSIDLSALDLYYFSCSKNEISDIDISDNINLLYFDCSNNNISDLDLTSNTLLEHLDFSDNNISGNFALTDNTALTELNCSSNQIDELIIDSDIALKEIDCSYNRLHELVITTSALQNIACGAQKISGKTVSASVSSEYPYQFDLSTLFSTYDNTKIKSVSAYDSSGTSITPRRTEGLLEFRTTPSRIVYEYDTGFSGAGSTMDITLNIGTSSPIITTSTLPNATADSNYSASLSAEGTLPITWTAEDLPESLRLTYDENAGTAQILGIPAEAGVFSFDITVTNATDTYTKTFTLRVNAPSSGIAIDAAHFPDEIFRDYIKDNIDIYKDELLTQSEIESISSIVIPSSVSGIENLRGIEYFTALKELTTPDTITELDISKNTNLESLVCDNAELTSLNVSSNSALKRLSCVNNHFSVLNLGSNSLETLRASPQTIEDKTYSNTGNASMPYKFEFASIISDSDIDNIIAESVQGYSGSSRITTTYSEGIAYFESAPIEVRYNYDTGLNMLGNPMEVTVKTPNYNELEIKPAITTEELPEGNVGEDYSATLAADGTDSISWSWSGEYPSGLVMDSSGNITGIPLKEDTFTFTITAANDAGSDSQEFTITIGAPLNPPRITTTSLPRGKKDEYYYESLEAEGDGPITWTQISGRLPNGLELDEDGNVSGTPTRASTFRFIVQASNDYASDIKQITLVIEQSESSQSSSAIRPSIYTSSISEGNLNTQYRALIQATGTVPVTWSFDGGELPKGLSFDKNGIISGTPTETGEFTFVVRATNEAGSNTKAFTIKINGAVPTAPEITTGLILPVAESGTYYGVTLEASGTATITWTKTGGNLPDGLTFNEDGALFGTPSETGRFIFTVQAENSVGKDSVQFTLNVREKTSTNPGSSGGDNTPSQIESISYGPYRSARQLSEEVLKILSDDNMAVAAVLPEMVVEKAGRYSFTVSLNTSLAPGLELELYAFPEDDSESSYVNYYFMNSSNMPTIFIPADHQVTLVADLKEDNYAPVIAAAVPEPATPPAPTEPSKDNTPSDTSTSGGGGGCNALGVNIFMLAIAYTFRKK